MTNLDKVSRMPARTLLYGFLGFIAVATAVTMMSDPLDTEIGNGSVNPGDWSASKLKTYLTDNEVPFSGEDRRSVLVKLVKRHQSIQERESQQESGRQATESEPLLSGSRSQSSAEAENQRLMQASNVK